MALYSRFLYTEGYDTILWIRRAAAQQFLQVCVARQPNEHEWKTNCCASCPPSCRNLLHRTKLISIKIKFHNIYHNFLEKLIKTWYWRKKTTLLYLYFLKNFRPQQFHSAFHALQVVRIYFCSMSTGSHAILIELCKNTARHFRQSSSFF